MCVRLRVQYILRRFYIETSRLRRSTDVASWSPHEILLSFISHLVDASLIDETPNKKGTAHPKIWEFVDFLRRYFDEQHYDGRAFLAAFGGNGGGDAKPAKGFGLQMMKTVCQEYSLKSGPFSKVKKQCNVWATNLHKQSEGELAEQIGSPNLTQHDLLSDEQKRQCAHAMALGSQQVQGDYSTHKQLTEQEYKDIEAGKFVPNAAMGVPSKTYSKFVTDVSMYVKPKASDALAGKKWYWFNDSGGFKWVPYRDNDQNKLNSAWSGGQKSCLIINGEYRVEFDRSNPQNPQGNQYNSRMSSPGGRTVVCSYPAAEIHGIPVDTKPLFK